MCNYVDDEHIMPGWGCCKCRVYNNISREQCKHCQQLRCAPLSPDVETGRFYANRLHHKPVNTEISIDEKKILPREPLTKVIPVLHKLTQQPNLIPDAIVVGTGNTIRFTPIHKFKCSNILIWYSKHLIINQITIGSRQELAVPNLPGEALAAPVTLAIIEDWFRCGVLPMMLQEHNIARLLFSTITPTKPITIEIKGSFDIIALYGAELIYI